MELKTRLLGAGIGVLLLLVAGAWLLWNHPYSRAYRFPTRSEATIARFAKLSAPARADYASLVAYFADGFLSYATPLRANAIYPGFMSVHGRAMDHLEGFSRIAPVVASWLRTSGTASLQLPSGRTLDVERLLADAVTAGTDPASQEYWGSITAHDQRIVEAADIALALWLSRERVWDRLPGDTRRRVVDWLRGVNGKEIVDNNWHLFVVQVNAVLKALNEPHDSGEIASRMKRIKSFYRSDGWFTDGPQGPVDYYNAWGFHYHLHWVRIIDPSIEPQFISESTAQFAGQLLKLIGPNGLPIMGRSVCYRLAVTAPLIFASNNGVADVSAGQARRALDATWKYFVQRGAVKDGRVTQGYCADDPRTLDYYSGPASCLWSLRSLVAAMYFPAEAFFWRAPLEPLPVEAADFDLKFHAPGLRVQGVRETGEIRITTAFRSAGSAVRLQPYTWHASIRDVVLGGMRRPRNDEAKYRLPQYGSRAPFCGCLGDASPAH